MRNYLRFALFSCALTHFACSAGKGGGVSRPDSSTGGSGSGSGSTTGSGGEFVLGGGADGPIITVPNGTGGTANTDPGNPNITHPTCGDGTCLDFPPTPIMGEGVPTNVATLFGAPENFTAGGLCALEPQLSTADKPGAMLPANWVRPRFRVAAPAGIDVLEIRIKSPAEMHELVAYTLYKPAANGAAPSWYLPKEIWSGMPKADAPASGTGLANNAAGQPLTVTIRGINSKSPGMPVGIKGDFNIAPVVATGSMVFWTVNSSAVTPDSSKLLGFAVGDEGVAESLTLPQVKWSGQIGEDGGALRGLYDMPRLLGFVDGQVRCVGCHATIPDGSGVVFTDDWPWAKAAASLSAGSVGALPANIGAGAVSLLKMPWWGQQSFSPAHWSAGDRIMITSYGSAFNSGAKRMKPWEPLPHYASAGGTDDKVKLHQLAWINMESTAAIDTTTAPSYDMTQAARNTAATAAMGTGWGLIATGDTGVSAVSPSMSHDGKQIVYTTTDTSPDGHPDAISKMADIRTVPYNDRAGGTSSALMGAAEMNYLEYYPSYSADDKLIAFTRAPAVSATSPDGPYYNRFGQAMVIPATGGTPVALAANDPVQCPATFDSSPGVTTAADLKKGIINSWPKWSPDVFPANKKAYYFLVFSSARKYADEFSQQFELLKNNAASFTGLTSSSQLYLAAVVVDLASGDVTTYPAVYIWNQNRTPGANGTSSAGLKYSNLTPAWDPIKLPPLVIPEVPSDVVPK